jgi:hypothetical protein
MCVSAVYADDATIGYWRFEEGAADAPMCGLSCVTDSSSSANHGTPWGVPFYRLDVPLQVLPRTMSPNALSAEFDTDDDAIYVDSMFPFHLSGDATIEFWIFIVGGGHRAVLWTRADDTDLNRFNFYVHDGHIGYDYRSPTGVRHVLVDHVYGDMVWVGFSTWSHVAITRTDNTYRLYLNGELRRTSQDLDPDLPTMAGWQIAGRNSCCPFIGKLDEIRFAGRALAPEEFLSASAVLSCAGFEPPMADYPVTVRTNRALPLKATLRDSSGAAVTDADIVARPALQVLFASSHGGDSVDVTSEALPAGLGDEGNVFVHGGAGLWQFNLKTSNYTSPGIYTVTMVSGDSAEYRIEPRCETKFVIK